jgi:hypothetical protein
MTTAPATTEQLLQRQNELLEQLVKQQTQTASNTRKSVGIASRQGR